MIYTKAYLAKKCVLLPIVVNFDFYKTAKMGMDWNSFPYFIIFLSDNNE